MKTMIDLKLLKDLENDDILVYRNGFWVNIRKCEYIAEVLKYMKKLDNLETDISELKGLVKELRGED